MLVGIVSLFVGSGPKSIPICERKNDAFIRIANLAQSIIGERHGTSRTRFGAGRR